MKLAIAKIIAISLGLIFIAAIGLFFYAFTHKIKDEDWSFGTKETAAIMPSDIIKKSAGDMITYLNWPTECLEQALKIQALGNNALTLHATSCGFVDIIAINGTWKHRIYMEEREE